AGGNTKTNRSARPTSPDARISDHESFLVVRYDLLMARWKFVLLPDHAAGGVAALVRCGPTRPARWTGKRGGRQLDRNPIPSTAAPPAIAPRRLTNPPGQAF